MMTLPAELENRFCLEIEQFEKERKMPYITSFERLGMKKGLKEGEKKGLKEGEKKGEKKGLLRAIGVTLNTKFGEAGSQILDELQDIDDAELLARILERVLQSQEIDELRRIVSHVRTGQDL